jgi:hypothetical protein
MALSDQLGLEDQDSNGSNPFNDDLLLPGNTQTLETLQHSRRALSLLDEWRSSTAGYDHKLHVIAEASWHAYLAEGVQARAGNCLWLASPPT